MTDDDTATTQTATTGTPDSTLAAHVRGYAEAVRLHLADLGPEVAEDLTGGLEADLTEALLDTAPVGTHSGRASDDVVLDLAAHFGPAQDYAAELRSAAGLPPATPPRRRVRSRIAASWRRSRARWAARMEPVTSTPQWASLRRLGHELRPVWWVARGWLIGVLLVSWTTGGGLWIVPADGSAFLVMAGAALVSVQWGRGRWLPRTWLPRLSMAATVLALLIAPLAIEGTTYQVRDGMAPDSSYAAGYEDGWNDVAAGSSPNGHPVGYSGQPGPDGVWVDGMQVSNLFAFDADGDPIKDVQLYDDRGRPVRTVPEGLAMEAWEVPQTDGPWYFRPTLATDGRDRWNVYPLQAVPESGIDWSDGEPEAVVGVQPQTMPWPFLKAPVVIEPDGGSTAGDGAETGESEDPADDPSERPTEDPTEEEPQPQDPAQGPPSDAPGDQGGEPAGTVLDASPER